MATTATDVLLGLDAREPTQAPGPESIRKRPQWPFGRDGLYLFACHLEWQKQRSLRAYTALVAALDASDENIGSIAETFLRRLMPRPRQTSIGQTK